jgi:hypothetical protein
MVLQIGTLFAGANGEFLFEERDCFTVATGAKSEYSMVATFTP